MVMGDMELETELLIIGSGPGGYGAAFRAADLGLDVTLVDPAPHLGGVCLHRGCIPSKTLLYLAEMIYSTEQAEKMGLNFGPPQLDIEKIRNWKKSVIDDLATGLDSLCQQRGIELLRGRAQFLDSTSVRLQNAEISKVTFQNAIIACGSRPIPFPGTEFTPGSRIMNAAKALDLKDIPDKLLVVGGGYVGLELGTVYAAFGSRVSLVESEDRLLTGVDSDLVVPLQHRLNSQFNAIHLATTVLNIQENNEGVAVELKTEDKKSTHHFDKILVSIGRKPNSDNLGLQNTGIEVDQHGFIVVNDRQQTKDQHIYAVGDITGSIMLAHKATREGQVAAEVIAGHATAFDIRAIPAIIYTDPQIGWCGLNEEQAIKRKIPYKSHKFPWKHSGRARTMAATDGFTKILANPDDGRILGAGIVGRDAEGLIAEAVLAIEMGALAEDMALSLHPHPTLSETEAEAAELFSGSSTHLLRGKEID